MRNVLFDFLAFLRDRFSLDADKASELDIIESIKKGVEFRGINLWILVFAILIASIGLNVNSTAVIIGAMLISPIMGPIMGIGLGIGTNDFELIRRAGKNLSIAAFFSVLTSSIYFAISPISEAQSELLARTTPTIWDVFIAFFGGLAGIVAGTQNEKGNAIPGVAIATALMPPLCTAGYGIASANWYFFLGAIYLFFINAVFISLSTFLIVRFLKFPKKVFLDSTREKRVHQYILIITILTVLPSVYIAYRIVTRTVFEQNAKKFVQTELNFPDTHIINRRLNFNAETRTIEVTLIGERLDSAQLRRIEEKLPQYNLENTKLRVYQGLRNVTSEDIQSLRAGLLQDFMNSSQPTVRNNDLRISRLETMLAQESPSQVPLTDIATEIRAQYGTLTEFAINRTPVVNTVENRVDTLHLAFARFSRRPDRGELERLRNWLKVRIKADSVELIVR